MGTSMPPRRRKDPVQHPQWVLYRVSVLDFRTDYRTIARCGYIGISCRVDGQRRTAGGHRVYAEVPFARFLEHLTKRPFGDLIIGVPEVIGTYGTEEAARDAEIAAIAEQQPQYNVDDNLDHPDRVTPWAQDDMRRERDLARKAGLAIHDLRHSGYTTKDRGQQVRHRPAVVNGHSQNVAVEGGPAREATAPRAGRPARAAAPGRAGGPLIVRRLVAWAGFVVCCWAVAAAGTATFGMPVPFEVVVPLISVGGAAFVVWLFPAS